MNIRSTRQIFNTEEGLYIAFEEVSKIKTIVTEITERIKENAPSYNVIIRDNQHRICDLMFKGHTLLVQFYQAYSNIPNDSYLLLAIVDGYFDENGHSDMFLPAKLKEVIRLNFSFNENGEFGLRNQENDTDFYSTKDITEIWIERFFKEVLKQ